MFLDKYNLNGKTAIVTGGGRNIGLSCGMALAEAGAKIIVVDISPQLAESGCAEIRKAGYTAEAVPLDVTKRKDVDKTMDAIAGQHGSIDIMVCNAGIALPDEATEDLADEHWLRVIDVNLNGIFWCCRAAGRQMLKQGKGVIINTGSMSGVIANKPQRQCAYNASKAAVHHLTKSLAVEWAERGVRVNAVAPTYIDNDLTRVGANDPRQFRTWMEFTPMNRMGQCDEIASVVLFLASDASSLLTGSIILADGGYTCW